MKSTNITIIAIVLIFLFPCLSTADGRKNESGKGYSGKSGYHYDDGDHRQGSEDHGPGRYKNRHGEHEYRGYREHPYDKGRHYGHYKHKGHRYEYQGHWRSWGEWDRYARKNPQIYEHGQYYREDAHLMFRFCEPGSGACFFFSIGK